MLRIGEQDYSDEEVRRGLIDKYVQRMDQCRKLAEDYFDKHCRKKSYRMDYWVDPGKMSIYAHFTDDELEIIRKAYEDCREEYNQMTDEQKADCSFEDFSEDLLDDVDVDFLDYVPDEDLHWAGGDPKILHVDLEDVKKYSTFIERTYTDKGDEVTGTRTLAIELSDEEYIDLLAAKLFDEKLTCSDLRDLMPDIYERIMASAHTHHYNYAVFFHEISNAAKEVMDSLKDDEKPFDMNLGSPFLTMYISQLLKDPEFLEKYPEIAKAINLCF